MKQAIQTILPTKLFKEFFESERTAGITLIVCTAFSLLMANIDAGGGYLHFWHSPVGTQSVEYWINDGLMAIFFLLIGLELEREIYLGELSSLKEAVLPVFSALGGMLVPAGIYLLINYGTSAQSGVGIPMATDIAFAIGVLSLLGNKVPTSLKIFLTALAVIDDLGAIMVIAIFYTKDMMWNNLFISLGIFILLLIFNRLKIKKIWPYLAGGVLMWYFMLNSGVHATITGVLLAFAIPFGNGDEKSTSYVLQHFLHKPVSFFILPLFALANTAIVINSGFAELVSQSYTVGIALGLIAGKPIGIFLFGYVAVALGLGRLPSDLNWKAIFGAGCLGGIGFTMSIFITLLAFEDKHVIDNAKLSILIASLVSGVAGFIFLKIFLKKQPKPAL